MRGLSLFLVLASSVAAAQPAPPGDTPPVDPPPPGDAPKVEPPPKDLPPQDPPPQAVVAPAPAAPVPPRTERAKESLANDQPSVVSIGGYLQPQFRLRQDSPAQFDQDGFRFARARVVTAGKTRAGDLELSAYVEAELQPTFALQDAYASLGRTFATPAKRALPGRVQLDGGQMRVPISRQNLLSDSRLSFVDKAQIATLAPERDLGVRLTVAPPIAPLRVIGGMFNGEGKNQVENINQSYLYAARVEASLVGRDAPLAESAFGGDLLVAAASYGRNKLTRGNGHEVVTYLGADVAAASHGLSVSFEYLVVKHRFDGLDPAMLPRPFKGNGWVAQLAYLLPPHLPPVGQGRLEIAARVEEIDRNDTIPIPQLGDPNQSVREITGVLSFYLRMHSLKAQLALSHFEEIEDRTSTGGEAAYDNDQLLVQITYRIE